jgi:predicted transcriptional regulator
MKKKRTISPHWLGARHEMRTPDLGPREMAVLERLWASAPLSAQDLRQLLDPATVSLSTVQSTLERLHRKRLVSREKAGRAFRYRAALDRSTLISRLLEDLAREVGGGEVAPVISGFVAFAAGDDPHMKASLTRLLEKRDRHDD